MMLRVTDLMIDAGKKLRPKIKCIKTAPIPRTCRPHTRARCKTCTTVTAATKHFTTPNRCSSLSGFDESAVRGELLSQLRVTLAQASPDGASVRVAA